MDLLFKEGKFIVKYPLKFVYLETPVELQYPAQVMFVVPKRNFKKAHDRNTLKRRIREAYRLNKQLFYQKLSDKNTKVIVAFLYTGKKEEEYFTIEKAVLKILNTF